MVRRCVGAIVRPMVRKVRRVRSAQRFDGAAWNRRTLALSDAPPHPRTARTVAPRSVYNPATMKKILFAALALVSMLVASPASAQLAPYNAAGVTMGHWHIA